MLRFKNEYLLPDNIRCLLRNISHWKKKNEKKKLNTQQGILRVRCHISQKSQSPGMSVCCASVLAYETFSREFLPTAYLKLSELNLSSILCMTGVQHLSSVRVSLKQTRNTFRPEKLTAVGLPRISQLSLPYSLPTATASYKRHTNLLQITRVM